MAANDLAVFALTVATLEGLVLGFLLAAAAIVFSSLAPMATDMERLAVQTMFAIHDRYLRLTLPQRTLLSGSDGPDSLQTKIVDVVGRTSFNYRTLDRAGFEREFKELDRMVVEADSRLNDRIKPLRTRPDREDDVREVLHFSAAFPGYLTEFVRAYNLFADQCDAAGDFARTTRYLPYVAFGGLVAASLVAGLNFTTTPSVGGAPEARAVVAAMLTVIMLASLGWSSLAISRLLERLSPAPRP